MLDFAKLSDKFGDIADLEFRSMDCFKNEEA